jgi:hypothetical protein
MPKLVQSNIAIEGGVFLGGVSGRIAAAVDIKLIYNYHD